MNQIRTGGYAALFSPIIFILFAITAISNYISYSPFTTYFSDLGIGINSALFFNLGISIVGLLGILVAVTFWKFESKLTRIGSVLFLIGSISLTSIGLFTETFGIIHSVVSHMFFVFTTISLLFIGSGIYRSHKHKVGILTLIISVFIIVIFVILGKQPITEFVTVSLILFWSFATGLYLISNQLKTKL